MIAYKCDICGVLYEHNLNIEVNDYAVSLCSPRTRVDACPECIGAIQTLIYERKEKKNEQD